MTRQTFRWWAIAAFVALLPAAAHAIWDQLEANRFSRYVLGLQAKGEPIDDRDGQQRLASEEERRASRLYASAALLATDGIPPLTDVSSRMSAERHRTIQLDEQQLAALENPAPTDAGIVALQAIVSQSQAALRLLDEATPLRFTRFDVTIPVYSYRVSNLINLTELDQIRTDLASFQGDGNSAADSLLAGVRLRRTMEGIWNSLATGTFGSLRLLLARTQPDTTRLASLQSAYDQFASDDGLAQYLTQLRARLIGGVWDTSSRPYFAQRIHSTWRGQMPTSLEFVVLRPWMTHRLLRTLHEIDAMIDLARRPWPEKLRLAQSSEAQSPAKGSADEKPFIVRAMNRSGLPAWTEQFVRSWPPLARIAARLAQNRVAVAALATERWRRAHDGALPPTLRALVPAELATIPLDPFDGQPLRFEVLPDAYVIYSIGDNMKDEGGQLSEWMPDLPGPLRHGPNQDIGIRVPLKPVSGGE
jgi:hypothetical protein